MACSYRRRRPALVADAMWGVTTIRGVVQQRVVGRERLGLGHVERRRADLTGVDRVEQRLLVDQARRGRCSRR